MKKLYKLTIKKMNKKKKDYSVNDMLYIINNILKENMKNSNSATPILRITKEFDIKVYQENLKSNVGYKILKGDEFKEIYKSNKVIIVNAKDDKFSQRFYITLGLVCFLFYDGENIDENKENIEFISRVFLMPTKEFKKQFNIASGNGKMFTVMYLSKFFEVNIENIENRIKDLT